MNKAQPNHYHVVWGQNDHVVILNCSELPRQSDRLLLANIKKAIWHYFNEYFCPYKYGKAAHSSKSAEEFERMWEDFETTRIYEELIRQYP